MSNPPRELHEIYTDWRARVMKAAGGQPKRNLEWILQANTPAGQAEIARVGMCLSQISFVLERLRARGLKVGTFKRMSLDWWRGLTTPTTAWNTAVSSPDVIIDKQHLDEIEAVADFLDGHVDTFDVTDEQVHGLRELLVHVESLTLGDLELSDELRRYILKLIAEIRAALDDEQQGVGFDYADAVMRLKISAKAAASEETSMRRKWTDLLSTVVTQTTVGVLVHGSAVAIKAITGF